MYKRIIYLIAVILLAFSTIFAQEETEPANASAITGTQLPTNAVRVMPESVPAELNDAFEKLVAAADGKVTQGDREVLAWTKGFKRSKAAGLMKEIQNQWQQNNWQYEVSGRDNEFELFGLFTEQPKRRVVLGFFVSSDDALVLALMEVLPLSAENNSGSNTKTVSNKSTSNNANAKVVSIDKNVTYTNLMGNEMPPMPIFPALKPKAGFVRGYVKDWTGKPLKGAAIGVRSSYLAGMYSGSQGKTDANGFYEFSVPKGSAHFYNAGYAIDWGEGLAALGLHPADGSLDSFVTTDGAVENFVLMPYGVTSLENLQENPRLASSYYGGSLYIGYSAFEKSDNYPQPYAIQEDSIIEITLTSEGEMFGGLPAQNFVIRKTAGFDTGFKINNIPLGRYQINAKANGKALKLKLNSPRGTMFGMSPNETSGTASILFAPSGAKAEMVSPQFGGWDSVDISIERQ